MAWWALFSGRSAKWQGAGYFGTVRLNLIFACDRGCYHGGCILFVLFILTFLCYSSTGVVISDH